MSKYGKQKNDDSYMDRQSQEKDEKMETVKVDVPEGRLQSEGQIATTMDASDVATDKPTGLALKKDSIPSQVVHTKKVAEIKKQGSNGVFAGGGSSGALGLRSGSYSGGAGVIGDMSATTKLSEADRKPTRTGKKLDSTLKHINYLYNEQVTVDYDESKPLAENPAATQGYNGTYRNEHARTQKKSGFVPGELYYDRSVDEIHQDFIYPVLGQSINDPAATSIPDYDPSTATYGTFSYPRGNYCNLALKFKVNSSGSVTQFEFTNMDITPDHQDEDVANISAVNSIIDANTVELDRQVMDANAGDELGAKWNPLPRSIKGATDVLGVMRDIEASTGAEVFMAYKKTAAGMSYQLNKAAKDGQRITEPIDEMLLGCMNDSVSDVTVVHSVASHSDPFTTANYINGNPSLIIGLFDSPRKYTTKGDFLLQPRGFRMHLQTADNNMNVLRVPEKFVKAVNSNEVFSTIDKEYDPFLPVCISDKASLAHPTPFSTFVDSNAPKCFRYKYTNNSNNTYIVEVYHPLIKGIYDFIKDHGQKLYDLTRNGNDAQTVTVPCMHSTTGFSLWSLLVLAATPYIVKARIPSFIDVISYEESFNYPFRQLVALKDANPMAAKNYVNSDYNEPLKVGTMSQATAFKWVFPETYWIQSEKTNKPQIVMPWYHNELQYTMNSDNECVLSYTPCVMSFPSLRSGSHYGFLDTMYAMEERDVRLCLDRQTVYPCYKLNQNTSLMVYKYGKTSDGILTVQLKQADFTIQNLMKTPREMGWVIPAPNGMLTQLVKSFSSESNFTTGRLAYNDTMAEFAAGNFRIRYWQGTASDTSGILANDSVNINRAMSLQQKFKTIINQRMVGDYRDFTCNDFILSLAACFDGTESTPTVIAGRTAFKPFMIGDTASTDNDNQIVTLQKYYWTRIQRLPFAINPFDCSPQKQAALKDDDIKADPYDFIYIFGCAGFRGSDYNEDSYNREKERLNLGMLFINDPYFDESPAFRGE